MSLLKKSICIIMTAFLTAGLQLPVFAQGENDTETVSFTAAFENASVAYSAEPGNAVLNLGLSEPHDMLDISFNLVKPDFFTCTGVTSEELNSKNWTVNSSSGLWTYVSTGMNNARDIKNICSVDFTIPAYMPPGEYKFGFEEIDSYTVDDNYDFITWTKDSSGKLSSVYALLTVEKGQAYMPNLLVNQGKKAALNTPVLTAAAGGEAISSVTDWTSENTDIAEVDDRGNVEGKSAGTVIVHATVNTQKPDPAAENGVISASYPVSCFVKVNGTHEEDKTAWVTDENSHWHPCSIGGCTEKYSEAQHSITATVIKNATRNETGLRRYTCSVCGYTLDEEIPVLDQPVNGQTEADTTGLDLTSTEWDGKTVDTSWYFGHEDDSVYKISTAAQMAGLSALVNGLVNTSCIVYTGGARYSASQWNSDGRYVYDDVGSTGANSQNKATASYHYGIEDFNGKTIKLTASLDMEKGNYMPVGGQYLMTDEDSATKLGSSFCGVFDGGGNTVFIKCDRHCGNGNYGDGQSVGLIGRLGVHDNDPDELKPAGAAVRNVCVEGSIYANRSVGGIVGKVGKTKDTAVIENCVNNAAIKATDSKGTGGICGSSWNDCAIRNCYNTGSITNTGNFLAGGISGSNEGSIENCYNVGKVKSGNPDMAMAIGTNNMNGPVSNCWFLDGSAAGGGYYPALIEQGKMTSEEMKADSFVLTLGSGFVKDTSGINSGYPVLKWQNSSKEAVITEETIAEKGTVKTETSVSGGVSTTIIDESVPLTDALDALTSASDKHVVFDMTTGQDTDEASITLAAGQLKEIGESSASGIRILTDRGTVTIEKDDLEKAAALSADLTVNLKNTGSQTFKLVLTSGGSELKNLSRGIKLKLPVSSGNTAVLCEGSEETPVRMSVIEDGYAYMIIHDPAEIKIISAVSDFDDVSDDAWYSDPVNFACSHELFNGMGDRKFAPSELMNRAMLAAVMYRLSDASASDSEIAFSDVESGQWYSQAVSWAAAQGIVKGYSSSTFGVTDPVTREQLAVILYRYAQSLDMDVTGRADLSAYSDRDQVSDWAQDAMEWCVSSGIANGSDGRLDPQGNASRAEVAAMLMRLVAVIAK